MKPAEGTAALPAIEENLAPLLRAEANRDPADRVYRMFRQDLTGVAHLHPAPVPGAGEWHEEWLLDHVDTMRERYSPDLRVSRLSTAASGPMLAGVVLMSTFFVLPDRFGHPNQFIELLQVVMGVATMLGGPVAMLLMAAGLQAAVERRSSKTKALLAHLVGFDMTGMVEVINPDPATAAALDRAKAHARTAEGHERTAARQHYYDLLVEVSTGVAGHAAGTREEQWQDAWRRWCAIDDAWTDLMCDPYAALTHSELLDVTLPRTAAFVAAYAEARDAMTGRTAATTPDDLTRLVRLVTSTETAWTEARDHAAHAGYAWLPEAECTLAATADKALTLAFDTTAEPGERANAAARAARLLARITTVRLPDKAHAEIAHISRKALPSPKTHTGAEAGPILNPGRVAVAQRA